MTYFGSSIGIAVRGAHIDVVCARGRWNTLTVSGCRRIENFFSRPAAEVAAEYQRFLRDNEAQGISATVVLPRAAGLIRVLDLPAQVTSSLADAVAFQVDTLHPFEEGGVYFDFTRLVPDRPVAGAQDAERPAEQTAAAVRVAVALAEKSEADRIYDRFRAVGIDIARFTFPAAVMLQAMDTGARGANAIVIDRRADAIEFVATGRNGNFCSREIPPDAPIERETAFCRAELRLKDSDEIRVIEAGEGAGSSELIGTLLKTRPNWKPSNGSLAQFFVAYAGALAGLELHIPGLTRREGLSWNLLPAEKRIYRSHWATNAAYGLAGLVLLLTVARLGAGWVQDIRYARWLDAEIRAVAPKVAYLEKLDGKQKALLAKVELISREQRDVAERLEAWRQLTALLPNGAWVQSMSLTGRELTIAGQANAAGGLLQLFANSPYFEQPELLSPITRTTEGSEQFRIRMRVRERPLAVTAAAAGASSVPASAGQAPASTPGAASPATAGPSRAMPAPVTPGLPSGASANTNGKGK